MNIKNDSKRCVQAAQHDISEQFLIQYFYEGLLLIQKKMTDATMTLQDEQDLISTMTTNFQQFRTNAKPSRMVHKVSTLSWQEKIDKIANIGQCLVVGEV